MPSMNAPKSLPASHPPRERGCDALGVQRFDDQFGRDADVVEAPARVAGVSDDELPTAGRWHKVDGLIVHHFDHPDDLLYSL